MSKDDVLYTKTVELVLDGHGDEACLYICNEVKNEIVKFLTYKYGWSENDAEMLFHDAWLVIEEKILAGELTKFNKSYIISVCRYIGANNYRKVIKERTKYNGYVEEEFYRLKDELFMPIEIEYSEAETTMNGVYEKALRSYTLLKEKCREIIRLKFVEEMSHSEIVTAMGNMAGERVSITTLNRCIDKWKDLMMKVK